MDIKSLLAKYPQLGAMLKMYGIDPAMIANMDPETIRKAVETYVAANGGTLPNIPGLNGGASAGGNNGGTNAGGGSNNNSNNNGNNNGAGGPLDWGEIAKLMNSGDKTALEEYVRTHSGTPAGGNAPGGNTGGGRGGSPAGGNSGSRGGAGGGRRVK